MSLRYFSKSSRLSVVTALVLGLAVCGAAPLAAADDPRLMPPTVQTYADQALPLPPPPSQEYYNSPLAAGTLTLEDVLDAHKPTDQTPTLPAIGGTPTATATAPVLTPPKQSSSTGLMLSQGMKEVLQKVGDTSVAPVQVRAPVNPATQQQAEGQPASLVPSATPVPAADGLVYQPGQEPKSLGSTAATPSSVASAPALDASALSGASVISTTTPGTTNVAPAAVTTGAQSCDQNPQKWDKTCGEAGYPSNYVGKIVGETRTGCADGALHDVWITNTCAPPDTASTQTSKTDGACGGSANNEFDEAPTASLCAQGIASAVNGTGPWTWACSGINGGEAAACTAHKRVASSNGSCGSANGVAASSAPYADLCDRGTATPVKGTGPWTWSCKGMGAGSSESCIAPFAAASVAAGSSSTSSPVAAEPLAAEVNAPVEATASASPATNPSSEKGELCGAAAEILAYQVPEKDLCRVGTASTVNGDGPWTWSCTDNEGVTSSCRTLSLSGDASPGDAAAPQAAPQAPVVASSATPAPQLQSQGSPFLHPPHAAAITSETPACGIAASQSTMTAPTSDLCEAGKASAVHGSNPWRWTCGRGSNKASCVTPKMADASCGVANGTALKSAPFSGLCSSGTPSGIEGDGPWNWTCNGSGGGASVSCAASVDTSTGKVDGSCGASDKANASQAPTNGLCASGTPSAVGGNGPWTWSCSGMNGGAVSVCAATKVAPPKPPGPTVNGLCGFANGVTAATAPSDGLCGSGDASAVVGNGPWNWSCGGENGGMTVSCTAPLEPPAPIDGACGPANGVATLVKPQSGLCSAGLTGSVHGKGPWTWTCSGADGGSPASCIAAVAGKTGSMPSTMTSASAAASSTSASDDMDSLADAPPPSGLVTPHLPSSDNMPSLDKKVIPSLTSSKAFATAPSPSRVPASASVIGNAAPDAAPDLPDGSQPLQPPALAKNLPSAAVLQDKEAQSASIPGNHLTLDPTISTVLFTRGSGNIDDDVTTELDRLANVLQENPDVRISLFAYADNGDSTPRDARRLSLTRGLAIKDYLSSKGISESRIDVHAEGSNTATGYMDRVDVKVND